MFDLSQMESMTADDDSRNGITIHVTAATCKGRRKSMLSLPEKGDVDLEDYGTAIIRR
jgi:hypothetical protein